MLGIFLHSEDRLNWVTGVDRYVIGKVEGAIKTFDLEKGEICGGIEAGTDQDPILAVTTILNREGMAIGQRLKYLFVKLKSFTICFWESNYVPTIFSKTS